MKICHIITRLIIGGAQENTLLTCAGLHARGHEVLLLAGPDTGAEGSLWDRARSEGFTVREIPSLHRAVRPLDDWRTLRMLRQIYTEFQPHIIHTHSSKAGILGRAAARATPAAGVVHTIHGMSFNVTQPRLVRGFYRLLERRAARQTDRIITVADAMIDHSVAAGLGPAEQFQTIYSGMRVEWFTPNAEQRRQVRASWGLAEDDVAIGTVARLFQNKGYEQLIPAVARAARERPGLHCVWIGDGPQRERFVGRMCDLGLGSTLHLSGLVQPDEVAASLQGIDMLVHCSQWEGLPRAVVQALLLEKPVISFDNDGAPEVVLDGDTGRLVAFNDVAGLAEAVVDLAENPAARLRMGRRGRELCLERFNHERMVDQLEVVYRALRERAAH